MSDRENHGMNCAYRADSDEPCTCGLVLRIALQTEQTMHAAWRKRAEEAERQNADLREALAVMADELADYRRAEQKYNIAKTYFSHTEFDGGSLWLLARTQANAIAVKQMRLAEERWNRGAPPHAKDAPSAAHAVCAVCRGSDRVLVCGPDQLPRCWSCSR